MSWARPWQGRKQADAVVQQPPHLMCVCKVTGNTSLHSTSSLLLSRPDIETSSIFICQHYQMSSHCCGHAAEQEASAKTGLQQKGGGIQSTTVASPTLLKQAEGISCETLDALNDAATHNYTLNAAGETLPTFTTCGTAENRKLIVLDGTWRSSTFLITTLQVWTLPLKESSLAKTMLKKTKSAAVNRLEGHNMPKCWEGRETPNTRVKGGSN